MNQMPCSATWLERVTDAGTRPLIPVRPEEEDERDRPAEVAAEIDHMWRVLAGLQKDVGEDGTVRCLNLTNEIAAGLIDRETFVAELVELVAADRAKAFTVTPERLWQIVLQAVSEEVAALADARVSA
jgi:hypothetical protein